MTNATVTTVVRNPLNRLMSSYLEMIKPRSETRNITGGHRYYKVLKNGPPTRDVIVESFTAFIDLMLMGDFYDPHMWTQTQTLKTLYGVDLNNLDEHIDAVLFTEDLSASLDALGEKHGIPTRRLPKKGVYVGDRTLKQLLQQTLSEPEILRKIAILLRDDILFYEALVLKHNKQTVCATAPNYDVYSAILGQIRGEK
jgi:hypothetical protein